MRATSSGLSACRVDTQEFIRWMKRSVAALRNTRAQPSSTPPVPPMITIIITAGMMTRSMKPKNPMFPSPK